MTLPRDPIEAVTHVDPYPYYAQLVAHEPIHRDESLGLWVAASAEAVTAVLTSSLCRVRPRAEPVPKALAGTPPGEIFRRLVRMNDGPVHESLKPAVSRTLDTIDAGRAAEVSGTWATTLFEEFDPNDFALLLSTHVIGSLLGVPRETLGQVALWTADLVACLGPVSNPEQAESGKIAAKHLLDLFHSMAHTRKGAQEVQLLGILEREAKRSGCPALDPIVANGIGLLTQSYEATAGLIGSTLIALASRPDVRREASGFPGLLRKVVEEVLRFDPPVQNTRRFLARSGRIAGHEMKEDDAVLVVLAAANRDPAANPNPDRFDVSRPNRRVFTFGAGVHACPGDALAMIIASAGVAELLRTGIDLETLTANATYRPSANVRVPVFARS